MLSSSPIDSNLLFFLESREAEAGFKQLILFLLSLNVADEHVT